MKKPTKPKRTRWKYDLKFREKGGRRLSIRVVARNLEVAVNLAMTRLEIFDARLTSHRRMYKVYR